MRFLWTMTLVGALAIPSVAWAQPSEADDEAARLLFNTGREAFASGDYETALERFRDAYRLSGRPALLYNIGTTLDRLRRDAEAIEVFEEYLERVPEAGNRAEIQARVATLRAAVAEREAAEAARLAEAERQEEARRAEEERRRQAEEAARLAHERAEANAAERPLPPVAFYATTGAGVGILAAGVGLLVRTNNLNDEYVDYVNEQVDLAAEQATVAAANLQREAAQPVAQRLLDDAESAQTLHVIVISVGGAVTVAGGVMAVFTDFSPEDDDVSVTPDVMVVPGGAVVGARGRF